MYVQTARHDAMMVHRRNAVIAFPKPEDLDAAAVARFPTYYLSFLVSTSGYELYCDSGYDG